MAGVVVEYRSSALTPAGRGAPRALAGGVLVVVAVGGDVAARVGRGQHLAAGAVGVLRGVAHLVGRTTARCPPAS